MPFASEEFQRIAGLISRAVDLTPQNDAMARHVDRVGVILVCSSFVAQLKLVWRCIEHLRRLVA